jgi:hypothetical protein
VAAVTLTFCGFFFGMLIVAQLFRWILLIRTTIVPCGGDFLGPPKRRLLWATPFALLMHPAPYILLGICWIAALAATGRLSYPWPLILGGFSAGAAFIVLSTALRLFMVRRARSKSPKG